MSKHRHLRNELRAIIERAVPVVDGAPQHVGHERPYAIIHGVGDSRIKPTSEAGRLHRMEHRFIVLVALASSVADTTTDERDRIASDVEYAVRTLTPDPYADDHFTVTYDSIAYEGASDVLDDGSGRAEVMISITVFATHTIQRT